MESFQDRNAPDSPRSELLGNIMHTRKYPGWSGGEGEGCRSVRLVRDEATMGM